MKKIIFSLSLGISLSFFGGCASFNQIVKEAAGALENGGGNVTQTEIASGLKEALQIGITKGADVVSKTDGYFKNPQIKIPLPAEAAKVEKALRDVGMGAEVDKAILAINRGAEDAAKSAKPIFVSAITKMTLNDAMGILKGTDKTAATKYLEKTTGAQLSNAFRPVITQSLDKTLATKYYGDIVKEYNKLPFITKKLNPDLGDFVTQKALDGLFMMIAKEEQNIRKDPLARVSALLKKVFKLQD
jgi:hypothetical protein